jgi:biopolymer transport protein ExbD
MINVIFLLILFFIVAANFDVHLQVSPPQSDAANKLPPEAPQLVVKADGSLFLNGVAVEPKQLASALKTAAARTDLKIAADASTDAVIVAKLIDEAGDYGITRVAIETLARVPPDAAP